MELSADVVRRGTQGTKILRESVKPAIMSTQTLLFRLRMAGCLFPIIDIKLASIRKRLYCFNECFRPSEPEVWPAGDGIMGRWMQPFSTSTNEEIAFAVSRHAARDRTH
jgi:hypothetical protein